MIARICEGQNIVGKNNKDIKIEQLQGKVLALESELKEVLDVLLKVSPEHKGWVMANWKHLYEE